MLSNVNIAYEGIQVKDVYPREVKDIFAGSQVLLIGKYKGSGKATVKLTGQLNGMQKAYAFPLSFTREVSNHTYLPRLWAMRRIGYLTDIASENGGTKEVIDEIIALSKTYGIISAYTSFLVTDPSENQRVATGASSFSPNVRLSRAAQPTTSLRPLPSPVPSPTPMDRAGSARGSYERFDAGIGIQAKEAVVGYGGAPAANSNPVIMYRRAGGAPSQGLPVVAYKGKTAVERSKIVHDYKWGTLVAAREEDKDQTIKTIEEKTFYLIDGFWTDSTYQEGQSPKPETIYFGSPRYFELVRTTGGISKYLAIGKQIVLIFRGHAYKIVNTSSTTS
ncbi:MAG: hypothetical protein HY711_00030 [Candidatus Melainabacteria bacterium]|nr:hypothetical protein [Candidatus Melainabacteria bacterium]